jgi:sulfopyruvate decarboxylase subunit beta
MRRAEAVGIVLDALEDELLVACNGMIGREAFAHRDRDQSFYMIGSMGLALSIGLGVALGRPDKRVVVLDGDGNLLMGLATLANTAAAAPANLLHVVLDNRAHDSTGGQRTVSDVVALEEVARACGYRSAERVAPERLADAVPGFMQRTGPALLLAPVERGEVPGIPRVRCDPPDIAGRFARCARA